MAPITDDETSRADEPPLRHALTRTTGAAIGPAAALRVRDPLRRLLLERVLVVAAEDAAEVLVIDAPPGDALPEALPTGTAMLVLSDDPAVARDAAYAGVLPRSASARQVAAAVTALAEGLAVRVPGSLMMPLPGLFAAKPRHPALTPREAEILALVGQGMSNKSIARRLGISAHTVKYHLEAVFAKLGVRSRAEAVGRSMQ